MQKTWAALFTGERWRFARSQNPQSEIADCLWPGVILRQRRFPGEGRPDLGFGFLYRGMAIFL